MLRRKGFWFVAVCALVTVGCNPPDVDAGDSDTAAESCPATEPEFQGGESCSTEGLECRYGEECCCGQCYDSYICNCRDGVWSCYYTDSCLRGSEQCSSDGGDTGRRLDADADVSRPNDGSTSDTNGDGASDVD